MTSEKETNQADIWRELSPAAHSVAYCFVPAMDSPVDIEYIDLIIDGECDVLSALDELNDWDVLIEDFLEDNSMTYRLKDEFRDYVTGLMEQ